MSEQIEANEATPADDSIPGGWVSVHRRILLSPVFTCPALLKVWLWCLLKASHRDRWAYMKTGRGGTQVAVATGQFIFGRKVASEELAMPESSINERMQKLQRLECISIQPGTHYSIVSVCNWSAYQEPNGDTRQATRHPSGDQPTGNRQPTDTDNNLNHLNNSNKETPGPTPDDLLSAWNKTTGTKRARELNGKRRTSARARLSEASWDWQAALSKFPLPLCESDPGGWQPDFDWFLRPGSVTAILEGKYDWKKTHGNQQQSTSPSRIHGSTPRKPLKVLTNAAVGAGAPSLAPESRP